MSEIPAKRARTGNEKECRACLTKLYDDSGFVDIFRAWDPAWPGMGLTIAEDLAKLTNIEINVSDPVSKSICTKCCCRLQEAIIFTMDVQTNDAVLREQYKDSVDENPLWPKPIQVDKNITSNALNEMTVEVKQEVLTEDECESNEPYHEDGEPNLEIKIEPEEITPAITVEINGPYSMQTDELEAKENGVTLLDENSHEEVKLEPESEDEAEPSSDMPKDCMLCFKTFHTVKGLKAHVIAVHSYDTVTSSRVDRPHVCTTCNISFPTRTDLFVHESCHSQFVCYVCDMKFDSFHLLSKHRSKQCTKTSVLPRLKTLDDVRRIARYRGTETLQLFDFHMPLARIKGLKIDGDECRKIMCKKEKKEKYNTKKRKVKDESNENASENDLYNILNDNVMSVVVNLRLPVEDKSVTADSKAENVQKKGVKIEYSNNTIIPKTEPELNNSKLIKPRHKRSATMAPKTNLYAKQYKTNKTRNLYNPLSKSIKSMEKEMKDLIPPEGLKVEIKQEIDDDTDFNIKPEEEENHQLLIIKDNKKNPQHSPRCLKQCKDIISEEFRLQVFEHFWSLQSSIEQRTFIRSLLERRISDENKFINMWHLRLGFQSYDICRTCLSDTLGLKYSYLHHTERLFNIGKSKVGKPLKKGVFKPTYFIEGKIKSPTIPAGTEKTPERTSSQNKNEKTNLAFNYTDQVEGKLGHNKTQDDQIKSSDEQSKIMNEVEQLLKEIHRGSDTMPEKCNEVKIKSNSKMVVDIGTSKENSQSNVSSMKSINKGKLNSLVANGSEKQERNEIQEELGNKSITTTRITSSCYVLKLSGASCIKEETLESNSITDKSKNVDAIKEVLAEDINNIKSNEEKYDINSPEVQNDKKDNIQETTIENICENVNSFASEGTIQKQSVESRVNDNSLQKNDENDRNIENLDIKLPIENSKANLSEDMDIQSDIHSLNEAMDIDGLESEIKNESDILT